VRHASAGILNQPIRIQTFASSIGTGAIPELQQGGQGQPPWTLGRLATLGKESGELFIGKIGPSRTRKRRQAFPCGNTARATLAVSSGTALPEVGCSDMITFRSGRLRRLIGIPQPPHSDSGIRKQCIKRGNPNGIVTLMGRGPPKSGEERQLIEAPRSRHANSQRLRPATSSALYGI